MKSLGRDQSLSAWETFMLRILLLAIAMSAVEFHLVPVACLAQVPARAVSPSASLADPLIALNDASRGFYAQAKAAALNQCGPVMIVSGDDLILRKGCSRLQVRVVPEIYHTLKAVAHVPLALDVALTAHAGKSPLPDDLLQALRDYRPLVRTAEARLATIDLTPEQRERQRAILSGCTRFLDSVLASKSCREDDRIAFARSMNRLVMANATDAARARLDALHHQVSRWKREMKPDDHWEDLTVLVIGRQLPRKDNLAVQYFARLLGEKGEGPRIVYAEGLGEEPRALDLLATRRVDAQIAIDFFNDDQRMNRDLLSDAARDYLPLLLDERHRSP